MLKNVSSDNLPKKSENRIKINQNLDTIWGQFKQKLSNLKNYMKYNLISNSSLVDFKKHLNVRLFDKNFSTKTQLEELKLILNFIIYFSYRSDFFPIDYNGDVWTSDCGWGCMIRASQMMLSRAIFLIKSSDQDNSQIKEENSNEYIKKMKTCYDTMSLFLEVTDQYKTTNNTSKDMSSLELINHPDFSIYNICKLGLLYGKGPGQWFSDVNMVNIFNSINQQLNSIRNTEILTFNDNLVEEEEILKVCFKEEKCECVINKTKCECLMIKDKNYVLKKNAIIFVSSRIGLDSIDPVYFTPIQRLFSIKNNIGMIGGKGNYALYFVGVTEDNSLIYLDPHFKQVAVRNIEELHESKNQQSYLNKNFYFLDIKNASPAFTFGFYFTSVNDFKQIQYSLNVYSKTENPIFKYKSVMNQTNQNKNNVENYAIGEDDFICFDDDDFCVISK